MTNSLKLKCIFQNLPYMQIQPEQEAGDFVQRRRFGGFDSGHHTTKVIKNQSLSHSMFTGFERWRNRFP